MARISSRTKLPMRLHGYRGGWTRSLSLGSDWSKTTSPKGSAYVGGNRKSEQSEPCLGGSPERALADSELRVRPSTYRLRKNTVLHATMGLHSSPEVPAKDCIFLGYRLPNHLLNKVLPFLLCALETSDRNGRKMERMKEAITLSFKCASLSCILYGIDRKSKVNFVIY
jgi:hypothetical protein